MENTYFKFKIIIFFLLIKIYLSKSNVISNEREARNREILRLSILTKSVSDEDGSNDDTFNELLNIRSTKPNKNDGNTKKESFTCIKGHKNDALPEQLFKNRKNDHLKKRQNNRVEVYDSGSSSDDDSDSSSGSSSESSESDSEEHDAMTSSTDHPVTSSSTPIPTHSNGYGPHTGNEGVSITYGPPPDNHYYWNSYYDWSNGRPDQFVPVSYNQK